LLYIFYIFLQIRAFFAYLHEKACKGTTIFSNSQIFRQKNEKFLSFVMKMAFLSHLSRSEEQEYSSACIHAERKKDGYNVKKIAKNLHNPKKSSNFAA